MTARPDEITFDPGLAALVLIARLHGVAADPGQLRHAAAMKTERFGERDLSTQALFRSLRLLGFSRTGQIYMKARCQTMVGAKNAKNITIEEFNSDNAGSIK